MNNSTAYALPGCIKLKVTDLFDFDKTFTDVCSVFFTDPKQVIKSENSRKRELVITRQTTMTLCRLKSQMSLSQIGMKFNKDHSTVLHSIKTVQNLRETDKQFRKQTDCLFEGLSFKH